MAEYVNQCGRCGSSIHYTDCVDCDGTGTITIVNQNLIGKDVDCDECDGDGFIAFCISPQEWCEANPLPGREGTPRNTVVGVEAPVGPTTEDA
jgi:DnaJ-class molecular chaperone